MTVEKVSIEGIDKKLDELLANQDLLMKHLKMQLERKLKGASLREQVKYLTEEGYSIKEMEEMVNSVIKNERNNQIYSDEEIGEL